MRSQRAFTLIEVMAVVFLIGLLAAATIWSLAADVSKAQGEQAIESILHVERTTRAAARRHGQEYRLQIDLDRQTLARLDPHGQPGHAVRLKAPMRVLEVVSFETGERAADRPVVFERGVVEIGYSSSGYSRSFGLTVLTGRETDKVSLVISGLTGQVVRTQDEDEYRKIWAAVAPQRVDAD